MGLTVPGTHAGWVTPDSQTKVIKSGNTLTGPAVAIVLCSKHLQMDIAHVGPPHEFVTGELYPDTVVGWGSGHYFPKLEDAEADYIARITRGH